MSGKHFLKLKIDAGGFGRQRLKISRKNAKLESTNQSAGRKADHPESGGEDMSKADPLKDFLRERGSPKDVVEGGLAGLVDTWAGVVKSVEQGYLLTLDDYLNDLDARQILEEALKVAPQIEREKYTKKIESVDEKMRSLLKPAGKCLWGDDVAEAEGWTAKTNWWYFHRPVKGDPDFLREIEEI
jgi:hypothetical protein